MKFTALAFLLLFIAGSRCPILGVDEVAIDSRDVLEMLGVDYTKTVVIGKPGKSALVVLPKCMQSKAAPVAFPFGKGDKLEFLLWTRSDSHQNAGASRRIDYRVTDITGVMTSGHFEVPTKLKDHAVFSTLSRTRSIFGASTGTMNAGNAIGSIYASDGQLLGQIFIELQ